MSDRSFSRLDTDSELSRKILSLCRLKRGEIWHDPVSGHRVGCLDASQSGDVEALMQADRAVLAIQDPPYNISLGSVKTRALKKIPLSEYISWSRRWVSETVRVLQPSAHLYVWLGADQTDGFQPLPDFMLLMREFHEIKSRSFITLRNQRGYGTQKNWMAMRQELLYYHKGLPEFNIEADYTEIPKTLRGYYKAVNGRVTENMERGKSSTIRAGNVWVDIQQVFYLMKENVPGCYAQKPLRSSERIILASSRPGDLIIDFFSHAGTTLIAAEKLKRQCYTMDIDPVFCEITLRRLERFRRTGEAGWQRESPFPELTG